MGADFYNPLELNWQYTLDDGETRCDFGESKSPNYVTLNTPTTDALFVTAVEYGSITGATIQDPTKLLAAVWLNFSRVSATRRDLATLHYYGNWDTQSNTAAALLASRDGKCTAWTDPILAALGAQGIVGTAKNSPANAVRDVISAAPKYGQELLVKNWDFIMQPYENKFRRSSYMVKGANNVWKYQWIGAAAVADAAGVAGQNTPNPKSIFDTHVLVKFTTTVAGQPMITYYDPSYGLTYDDSDDLAAKAARWNRALATDDQAFSTLTVTPTPMNPKGVVTESTK